MELTFKDEAAEPAGGESRFARWFIAAARVRQGQRRR